MMNFIKPRILIAGLLCLNTFIVNAQKNKAYFQQEVNYSIDVKLDDKKHELHGFISIEYINHSPDTLHGIYMHLWPNTYKNHQTALAKQLLEGGATEFYYSKEDERGYIDSLNFKVDNQTVRWDYDKEHIDIAFLKLNNSLLPGRKITISTPFRVKIPVGKFSRLGHDDKSYMISQWYPKPAVYDKNGWNQMPYLNQGEFYSEFGSFDVKITLPAFYRVGATGDLQTASEITFLDSLAAITQSLQMPEKGFFNFPKDEPLKTIHYKQTNVHDFAWFCSREYYVRKGQVELPGSGRIVTTWTMFSEDGFNAWRNSIEYMNDALYYYSLWLGDYPYNQATAVEGLLDAGGGMEYPNVTVITSMEDAFTLEVTIMHEIGHNWFYGILGSNERKHPWMDEGLNSYYEARYIHTKYPQAGMLGKGKSGLLGFLGLGNSNHLTQFELGYFFQARKNEDQPIELPSQEYAEINYGAIVYGKSALVFTYLEAYLGREKMDEIMKTYYEKWKFKHPQPEDLRAVFEEKSGKDLSWFFDVVIGTKEKIDYKIKSLKKGNCANSFTGDCYKVKVKNKGGIASPFSLSYTNNENKVTATEWFDGFTGTKTLDVYFANPDKIRIDANENIPEINRQNNTIRTKGIFKKVEKVQFQWLGKVENPEVTQIFYTPVIGWNQYNKLMPGIALYNSFVPQKRFEYVLVPMYATNTNTFTGTGKINYNFLPKNNFKRISPGISASHFSYGNINHHNLTFTKIVPEVVFDVDNKNARSFYSTSLRFRYYFIAKDESLPAFDANGIFSHYQKVSKQYDVREVEYFIKSKHPIRPHSLTLTVHENTEMAKVFGEAKILFKYPEKKKGVDVRLFAGSFIFNNSRNGYYNFGMSGNNDYLFNHVMFGRTDFKGVLSNQLIPNDGGFKNLTALQSDRNWLSSINIQAALPFKLPLSIYADAGISSASLQTQQQMLWAYGVAITVVPKVFEIYLPLQMSSNLNHLSYAEKVRFMLNFSLLNPFEQIKNFSL
jgi:hypothetical protein